MLPPPRVIGHRGARAYAPENTLAGLRMARALGTRWVEFDVRATRDDRAVLLHDPRLGRTTTGRGRVDACTSAEVERLDAGRWFGKDFAGEPVPRLETAVSLIEELGLGAVVEIKAEPGDGPRTMRAALRALEGGDPDRLILSSFDEEALGVAAAEAPRLSRALLVRTVPPDWQARIERLGCGAIHVGKRGLKAAAVAEIARVVPCRVYTVNAPARARTLLDWGAAAVFTDCPDVILSAIRPEAGRPVSAGPLGEMGT